MNTTVQLRETEQFIIPFKTKQSSLTVYTQVITPAHAIKLLENNIKNNRKINMKVVESYARQMEKGLWIVNSGEPLIFSEEGQGISFQHRMMAVIRAAELREQHPEGKGKFFGVEFLIVSNVPSTALPSIDDGSKRTLADALIIAGRKMPHMATAVGAVKCLQILHGCTLTGKHFNAVSSARRHSAQESLAFLSSLPTFQRTLEEFYSKFNTTKLNKIIPAGTAFPMYYLFHNLHGDLCFNILKSFEQGKALDPSNGAIMKVYAKLKYKREMNIRVSPHEYISYFLWALVKTVEQSNEKVPNLMVWQWSDQNIALTDAKKKLRGLDV